MKSLVKSAGRVISLILFSFFICTPMHAAITNSDQLGTEINRIIRSVDPNLNVGVAVKSMKYNDTLYTYNEHRLFKPASTLKVLTAEAALLHLGAAYTFPTRFYSDAKTISNGTLQGNLYLAMSGDPSLTYEDLAGLMEALKARGLQRVSGNVYIDLTAYDDNHYGPGLPENDKNYCYAAPISASIVNKNCLSFSISPNRTVGYPARIVESTRYGYSTIENEVITKPASARSCSIRVSSNPEKGVTVSGCMPKGRYSQDVTAIISETKGYNKSLVRSMFRNHGITISGQIILKKMPGRLAVLAEHRSASLQHLVNKMLKKSDNIIAGSLFKKVGETFSQHPGSWENGRIAVSSILAKKAGVNPDQMSVLDGSGLSPENKITPAQMLQVLDFAFHDHGTNYDFVSGLPVAGVDGTLKRRLHNTAWKVRAKTGYISGVNSLAGYAMTQNKEPIAFVIIVNGRHGLGWKYKAMEDKIVTAITKYTRG